MINSFSEIFIIDTLEDSYKSSKFWIQAEFLGNTIKSDIKLWSLDFMKEEQIGKTDFKLDLRKVVSLLPNTGSKEIQSIEFNHKLLDSIMNGLWIELYEEYPVLQEHKNDEGETISKVILCDSKPQMKTVIRGTAKVQISQWITNPDMTPGDLLIHKKYYFYKLKYKTIPEFCYENNVLKFKKSEHDALDAYVKEKRNRIAQKEAEEREKAEAGKVNEKKDPKKDKGGKKPEDKNAIAIEIADPEEIPYVKGKLDSYFIDIDYMVIERSYNQDVKESDNGEFEVPGKLETNKSKKNQENSKKQLTPEEKLKKKQKSIFKNYDVILSLNSWITVKIGLNQPEKVLEEQVQEQEPASKQSLAKGKKK